MHSSKNFACCTSPTEDQWTDVSDTVVVQSAQRAQTPAKTDDNDTRVSSKLLALVFTPILFLLRIIGLPVPSLCSHSSADEHLLMNAGKPRTGVARSDFNSSIHNNSGDLPATDIAEDSNFGFTTRSSLDLLRGGRKNWKQKYFSNNLLGKAMDTKNTRNSQPSKAGSACSQTLRPCTACRWKLRASKVLAVVIVCVMATNVARYSTVFSNVTKVTGSVVMSIVLMIFWVVFLTLYVQTYYSFWKHFPPLFKLLMSYDGQFGTCLDCRAVNIRIKMVVACGCVFWTVVTFLITFCATALLPSFRQHLAPLGDEQGAVLYIASGLFAVFLCLMATKESVLALLVNVVTAFIAEEFIDVGNALQSLLESSYQCFSIFPRKCNNATEGRRKTKSGKSCFGVRKRKLKRPDNHYDFSRLPRWRTSTIHDLVEISQGGHRLCGNHGTHHRLYDARDTFPLSTGKESKGRKPRGMEVNPSLEENFDQLKARHEFLCDIVKQARTCLSHNLAYIFIVSVPVFCVVVYGLAAGSMQWDECLFLSLVAIHAFFKLLVTIRGGIRVTESAHAPAAIIYSADWSALSDRLLLKMQMFCSRLGQEKIGYDVYGLFVIDRSTVLMMIGTLLTYTLVVIQFQQGEACGCNRATNFSDY